MRIPTRDWCDIHQEYHLAKPGSLQEYLSKFSEEELSEWSRNGNAPTQVVAELAAFVIAQRAELMRRLAE